MQLGQLGNYSGIAGSLYAIVGFMYTFFRRGHKRMMTLSLMITAIGDGIDGSVFLPLFRVSWGGGVLKTF